MPNLLQKMLQQIVYGSQGVLNNALLAEAASPTGSAEVIGKLLKRGAEIDGKNRGFETALHLALQHGTPEVQQKLLDSGADVNICNFATVTPLMMAARRDLATTQRVLAKNPDVNASTIAVGETALMVAVCLGKEDVARAIYAAGADATTPGFCGYSASTCALENNQPNLLRLFMPNADARLAFIKAAAPANTAAVAAEATAAPAVETCLQTSRTLRPLKPLRFGAKH